MRTKTRDGDFERLEIYKAMSDSEKENLMKEILSYNIIDHYFNQGYIPYTYSGAYGHGILSSCGYFLFNLIFESNKIQGQLYENLSTKMKVNFVKVKVIKFLNDINDEFGGSIDFDFVRFSYFYFVKVHEYDGLEHITFDENKFIVTKIKEINSKNISNDTKINQINDVLNYDYDDAIIYYEEENITADMKQGAQVLSIKEDEVEDIGWQVVKNKKNKKI